MEYKIIRTTNIGNRKLLVYDVLEDGKLIVGGLTKTLTKELDKTELDKLFTDTIFPSFNITPEPDEVTYTEKEVEDLLKDKGYLSDTETLSDLKPKTVEVNK